MSYAVREEVEQREDEAAEAVVEAVDDGEITTRYEDHDEVERDEDDSWLYECSVTAD